ncbi:MAG: GNAT family N-acetyltransferase [Tissierellia bacterium]|nr:GNAT family N-acetyltransferase [Tissierellia bacterium]
MEDEKLTLLDRLNPYFVETLEDYDELNLYKINDIDPQTLKKLLEFGESVFGEDSFDSFGIVSQIHYGQVYALLNKDRSELVGLAAFHRSWEDRDMAFLSDYAINEEAQGLSIGTRFLSRVLSQLHYQGIERVRLNVATDNDPAIAMYSNVGFEHHDFKEALYGKGEDRYTMEWTPHED